MTLDHESLFQKSRLYIRRGLDHRNVREFDQFQLWASLSLELLGKSALSKIHPALVADPQHWHSLFEACGRSTGAQIRSITAKTVFERLTHLAPSFGPTEKDWCMLLSERRNAELHSGALPFADMQIDSWLPNYWRIASIILSMQSKTIENWIGTKEAISVEDVLQERISALEQAVKARIERRKQEFDTAFPPHSSVRASLNQFMIARPSVASWNYEVEAEEWVTCPACGFGGRLFGDVWETSKESPSFDDGSWSQRVTKSCTSEWYECPFCHLELEGREEILLAGLPEDFEVITHEEPDYGDDYGNE